MKDLPYHDEVQAYNLALGNLATQANTVERLLEAHAAGLEAIGRVAVVARSW